MADCECGGIPKDAVILNTLTIVEYMDAEGEIFKIDLSEDSAGEPLAYGKVLELAGWGRMINELPIVADMIRDFLIDDDGEEEETAEL